jgi:hypothetical protein
VRIKSVVWRTKGQTGGAEFWMLSKIRFPAIPIAGFDVVIGFSPAVVASAFSPVQSAQCS